MAFLKDSDHDVFVSYAHTDNIPDREGEKGWVDQFAHQVMIRLLKHSGEQIEVWRDPELSRAQLFDAEIERAIRGSGVMLCLISPSSLRSEYCVQEIDCFSRKAAGEPEGLTVDNYLRIFPVLLYNIPHEEWPEPVAGTSAFMFHDAADDRRGKPLDPAADAFEEQLDRLVEELYTVLSRLQERRAVRRDPTVVFRAPFRVFLAQPTADLAATHQQLGEGLERQGIQIVPGIPPPVAEAEHAAAVAETVAKVDLSIHLLGADPGQPMDESDPGKTFPSEQARIALEHARSQLILIPEQLDFASLMQHTDYFGFVQELWKLPRTSGQLELAQVGRHQMLDEILAKRSSLEQAAERASQPAAGAPEPIVIDLKTEDLGNAQELVGYLVDEKKITPTLIPSADILKFQESLEKSKLFIVVFGTAARKWVQYRLEEAIKFIFSHQLETRIGVYVAPPSKPSEQVQFSGLFSEQYEVALNMSGFDPRTLDPLLV